MPLDDGLQAELDELARRDRIRCLVDGGGSTRRTAGPRNLISFASNDYLGLAAHPAVVAAAEAELRRTGVGAGSSRLVAGAFPAHESLERQLAQTLDAPAALLFPTGYQANLGVVTGLCGPEDLIASDALNHASLIDGCRLSRARVVVYRHADVSAARDALRTSGSFRRRWLITESLFSMEGDRAPLAAIAQAATEANAELIVDEAHAFGALGPAGRGCCAADAVTPAVRVGTLGKAYGVHGGFALVSPTVRAYLLNRARTFIYTTASPPALAAAATAALALAACDEGTRRRARLAELAARLADRLGLPRPAGPLLSLVLGSDQAATRAADDLQAAGLFVRAIRPPTVPEGTARLRLSLSAEHTDEDVARLAAALAPFSQLDRP